MKATFEGLIINIDKIEGVLMAVVVQVNFTLMVRSVEMDLHRHKESSNYWKPISFSCSAMSPFKLQNVLIDMEKGDFVTVVAEKKNKAWEITSIIFAKDKAEDFRKLMELNETIL